MKVSLVVGGVEITLSGVELTPRQVRDLMKSAASIALALPPDTPPAPEPDKAHPLGFTAHFDLAPADDTVDWYEEEE